MTHKINQDKELMLRHNLRLWWFDAEMLSVVPVATLAAAQGVLYFHGWLQTKC